MMKDKDFMLTDAELDLVAGGATQFAVVEQGSHKNKYYENVFTVTTYSFSGDLTEGQFADFLAGKTSAQSLGLSVQTKATSFYESSRKATLESFAEHGYSIISA